MFCDPQKIKLLQLEGLCYFSKLALNLPFHDDFQCVSRLDDRFLRVPVRHGVGWFPRELHHNVAGM